MRSVSLTPSAGKDRFDCRDLLGGVEVFNGAGDFAGEVALGGLTIGEPDLFLVGLFPTVESIEPALRCTMLGSEAGGDA